MRRAAVLLGVVGVVVDVERPLKLENAVDNAELAAGSVTVHGFAVDGVFDVQVSAEDPATREFLELSFMGSFAAE